MQSNKMGFCLHQRRCLFSISILSLQGKSKNFPSSILEETIKLNLNGSIIGFNLRQQSLQRLIDIE